MKLLRIFVDEETQEGLYAIQYPDQGSDEFDRVFSGWGDVQVVRNYCLSNFNYITTPYFNGVSLDMIETKIMDEAFELESLLQEYSEGGFNKSGRNLQMLFRPLNNHQTNLPSLQETKAKVWENRRFPRPLLRIYGIRLGENTFVMTGGAVKWTEQMKDHPDTKRELEKLGQVRAFLKANEIDTTDDLIYYYEQE